VTLSNPLIATQQIAININNLTPGVLPGFLCKILEVKRVRAPNPRDINATIESISEVFIYN
jgi:hypothetical protein